MSSAVLNIFFLVVLSLIPAIFWYGLLLQKKMQKEPTSVLVFAFLLGGLATIPSFLAHFIGVALPLYLIPAAYFPILVILFNAALEEVSKHSGAMFAMHQDLRAMDERTDGIVYGIVVGLGFAFVENSVYLWSTYMHEGISSTFWYIFVIRSLLTMVAHALFSGTFGYFYGISYIRPNTDFVKCSPLRITPISLIRSISLRNFFFFATRTIWRGKSGNKHTFNALEVLFEGYLIVIILHSFFNLTLSLPVFNSIFLFILIPFLFLLGNLLFLPFVRKYS